jgi:hypothetical protein
VTWTSLFGREFETFEAKHQWSEQLRSDAERTELLDGLKVRRRKSSDRALDKAGGKALRQWGLCDFSGQAGFVVFNCRYVGSSF